MKNIQLSICIPTYNREKYLKEAIESITCQLDDSLVDKVEICISDNASTDNTKQLIENFQNQYKNITYFRQSQNMGADMNYLKVIEIAHGNYCWFLGSDDTVLPTSISKIIKEIANKTAEIFSLSSIICNITLKKTFKLNKSLKDSTYTNSFECIKNIGTNFGYISSIVIKKSLWMIYANDKKFIGSAYLHVYIIFSILQNFNIKVKFIAQPYVCYRAGNDSFLSSFGRYKRVKFDIVGYNDIASYVFGEKSKELIEINRVTVRYHVFNHILIAILAKTATIGYRIKVFILCLKYYYKYIFFWTKVLPLLVTPYFILNTVRFIYRKTLKNNEQ